MTKRKSRADSVVIVKNTPNAALTLTIPVPKPRNPIATNLLLKKSAAHADMQRRTRRGSDRALEVLHEAHTALDRRRDGDADGGDAE